MRTLSRIVPAVAAALLAVLPAAATAQQSDASSVDAAILDVLLARGLIDQAQYEELLAMVHDRVESQRGEIELIEGRLARLRAPDVQTSGGQSGKLLFKSPDGKWSLGFKGRIQARVEHLNSEDNTQSGTNISVPRSRIGFEGTAGAENVRYKLEFDINTQKNIVDPSTSGSVTAKSIYIDWGFENGLALLLGQTEYPFGREALTSSANISFAERSIVFSQFEPEYEPLAMLYAKANEGEWEYYAAVSNGEGSGENNTAGTDQNGMRRGARVVWNPLGAVKNDGPAFQTFESGGTLASFGLDDMDNEENSGLNTATPGTDTDTIGYRHPDLRGPGRDHGRDHPSQLERERRPGRGRRRPHAAGRLAVHAQVGGGWPSRGDRLRRRRGSAADHLRPQLLRRPPQREVDARVGQGGHRWRRAGQAERARAVPGDLLGGESGV